MEEADVQKHLWLRRKHGTTNFFKPTVPFVFTQEENKYFLDFVLSIHSPIGYLATFKKHVGPKRLFAMKSHDYHVMPQQILSTEVRDFTTTKGVPVRQVISLDFE